MNKEIANKLLNEWITNLRLKDYDYLFGFMGSENIFADEIVGPDGQIYLRELLVYYDDKKTKNLRVAASIFQNPTTFFCFSDQVQDDFILSPEGKFIGE